MVRWVRDFNSIGRRERLAVNLSSLVIGAAIVIGTDRLNGVSLGHSIFNLGLVLIVGTVISYCYIHHRKREYLKDRQVVLP